jgi:DNA-binding IclR family transcriptional regulator
VKDTTEPYLLAQAAIAQLKGAVHSVLSRAPEGLKNVEIGKLLGIYMGHVEHEGHIPRTLLALMEAEGVVEQDQKSKTWKLKSNTTALHDDN